MRARGRSGEDPVGDRGCQAQRLERTFDDVRRDGSDHYLILFQVAGQSAMSQIDRTAQLAVGDVALIDAARPVTFSSRQGDTQWLSLRLPRSPYSPTLDSSGSAVSAGMKRVPGDCSSILFGDADNDSASSPSDSYMQLAAYDLVWFRRDTKIRFVD
jgi:hypothetical protein